jgi:hypothetical protein
MTCGRESLTELDRDTSTLTKGLQSPFDQVLLGAALRITGLVTGGIAHVAIRTSGHVETAYGPTDPGILMTCPVLLDQPHRRVVGRHL